MLMVLELVVLCVIITSAKDNIPPRTVNLELDTSFFFDPGDANSPLVMGLRRLLDKIDETFKQNNILRTPKPRETIKFIDFLKELKEIIVNFDDDSVKSVFKNLNEQVQRNNANGNSELHKIIFESKLKRYVVDKIKELSDLNPKKLKSKLNNVLKWISNINPVIIKFASMLNGFFHGDDSDDLENTLARFKEIPKKGNAQEIVKNTLELIVYDRYRKLNYKSKTKFAEAITKLNELVPEGNEVEVHIFRNSGRDPTERYVKNEEKDEFERDSDEHIKPYSKNGAFSNKFNTTSRREFTNKSVEDKHYENTNSESSTDVTKADSKAESNQNNNTIASTSNLDAKLNPANETRTLDESTKSIRDRYRRTDDDEIVIAKDLDDFSAGVKDNVFVDADDTLKDVTEVTRDDENKDIVVGRDVEIFVRAFSDQ